MGTGPEESEFSVGRTVTSSGQKKFPKDILLLKVSLGV